MNTFTVFEVQEWCKCDVWEHEIEATSPDEALRLALANENDELEQGYDAGPYETGQGYYSDEYRGFGLSIDDARHSAEIKQQHGDYRGMPEK